MNLIINKVASTRVGGTLLAVGLVLVPSAYGKNSHDSIANNDSQPTVFDFESTYDKPATEEDIRQQRNEQSQNKQTTFRSKNDSRYQDDINDLIFALDNPEESQLKRADTNESSQEELVMADDNQGDQQQYQMIEQIQPHSEPEMPLYPTGECNADALALGIEHFRYADAPASDLVNIGGRRLHKDAAPSLKEMQAAAKQDKVTLTVGSAFRSIRYQSGIINRKKRQGLTDEDIYSVSAPAGYSEHSTGYAVDFYPIDASFAKTKAYQWLLDNAAEYGWIQSFTEEVSEQSNVMVEPWHWRFEGTSEAQQLFSPRSCYSSTPPAGEVIDGDEPISTEVVNEDLEVIELERKDFALQEEWEEYLENKHKDIVGD
ncbi:M15 family metallopeptidase [Psychrobacter lutiphocae]|uniref:M15 family metallopeptidase n=1 Tax=Psychrobacter lutiphocae TaxID=540500 RepID=UPI000375950A|nr:M15 family metallopeptidase [Psychrobacter lutiphocae]